MARTVSELLKLLAPEFADAEPALIEFHIEMAADRVNRRVFGAKADQATALLAAHSLKLAAVDAAELESGTGSDLVIKSQSIGELSVTYDTAASAAARVALPGDEEFAQTSYGIRYVQLRRSVATSPGVV
jgi:Protein of unknown function (DUF4054)